ncbi:MAG: phosphopentomutase, partial [Deltaproteobacteria bacterium]|nr:phosphopentomutase [Deltaproteobacteria bacterium]
MPSRRAVIIVFDSLGIGELPDAAEYNDSGSNTLSNIAKAAGPLHLKTLSSMGLGLIEGVSGIEKAALPTASYGRMAEASKGKDTTTGHWEMSGVILESPLCTFPNGFPDEILELFSEVTGYGWLWGKAASGTEIIERLGAEHLKTGKPIVYTSADSVFQVAAHEDVISTKALHELCVKMRAALTPYGIGRVIARPFVGAPGSFKRTKARKDFSLEPPGATMLDILKESGKDVVGIGKIPDIFVHKGFTKEVTASTNADVLKATALALDTTGDGLIFSNLVDFDMHYGHRNDAAGYARALEAADKGLEEVVKKLGQGDIMFITADHGCDPTTDR